MLVANWVVGVALLLFGRRLFWLFLAGTGFAIGAWLSVVFLEGQSDSVKLGAALALGVLGALVAFKAQKMAVGLGGFLAGAYVGNALWTAFQFPVPGWVAPIVGGVVGAILLAALFNWTLIVLSSLLGAALVYQNVALAPPWPVVAFFALLVLGLSVQSRQYARRKAPAEKKKSE
jgi:uncharacterized membrane protein YeaQ/YmgE (transglycosylase-associated protein family)